MREGKMRAKDSIHKSRNVTLPRKGLPSLSFTVSLSSEKGRKCPAIGSKTKRRTQQVLAPTQYHVHRTLLYSPMGFNPRTET